MLAFRTLKGGKCKMKAILLAVKPNQLVKILNGEKTIEVRKSKLPLNIPVYLYCTKGKPYLVNFGDYEHLYKAGGMGLDFDLKNIERHGAEILNGKVVAKCMFSEVIEYEYLPKVINGNLNDLEFTYLISNEDLSEMCLSLEDLEVYGNAMSLYGHTISNLEIFGIPKSLGEFGVLDKAETKRYDGLCKVYKPITKAPQSWCYVEEFK
jgi:hypothetical protein